MIKPTIKILVPVYTSRAIMMHTLHCYFKPGAGYISAVHEKQKIINTAITVACGEATVKKTDKRENGEPIELTKFWANLSA